MRGPEVFLLLLFIAVPWILGWISKNHWAHQRYLKALELRAEANNQIWIASDLTRRPWSC